MVSELDKLVYGRIVAKSKEAQGAEAEAYVQILADANGGAAREALEQAIAEMDKYKSNANIADYLGEALGRAEWSDTRIILLNWALSFEEIAWLTPEVFRQIVRLIRIGEPAEQSAAWRLLAQQIWMGMGTQPDIYEIEPQIEEDASALTVAYKTLRPSLGPDPRNIIARIIRETKDGKRRETDRALGFMMVFPEYEWLNENLLWALGGLLLSGDRIHSGLAERVLRQQAEKSKMWRK